MEVISKPYNNGSKRLLKVSAQELLDWLAPGACFTGQFSKQFHSAEIEADSLIEARYYGLREFVQVEFQSGPDPNMAQRLLEYYIQAYSCYRCPVRSYVIYLRKGGMPPASPLIRTHSNGTVFLHFHFEVILLWKVPHREILDYGRQGLFPLVPLMDGGACREVIEEIIIRLLPIHGTIVGRELLTLTSLFASLAFTAPEDRAWSRRRFAMLKDIFQGTPQHEYYLELARDEVLPQVRAEVMQQVHELEQKIREETRQKERQVRLQAQRTLLLKIIQVRFPTLVKLAKAQSIQIKEVTIMEGLMGKVGMAQTAEEAMNALLDWQTSDNIE